MATASRIIGPALLGSLVTGILAVIGFLVGFGPRMMLGLAGADDIRVWSWFSTMMGSAGIASCGFALGALYGIVRAHRGGVG